MGFYLAKQQKGISRFFKKKIGNTRTLLTDSLLSQIDDIKMVWPEANIIYCAMRIDRIIKTNVGIEMLHFFDIYGEQSNIWKGTA